MSKEDVLIAIQWKKDLVLVEKIVPDQVGISLNKISRETTLSCVISCRVIW